MSKAIALNVNRAKTAMMALATSMMLLIILNLPANAIEIQEVVSPKGIKAWLVEDNSVPLVSMRFSFKGGTSQDPGGKEGLANLMTGLLTKVQAISILTAFRNASIISAAR